MNELEILAYHEAGHTVTAFKLNVPVKNVTIIHTDEYDGAATLDWEGIIDDKLLELYFNYGCPKNMSYEELEEYVKKVVIQYTKTILAGSIAEKIYGNFKSDLDSNDFDRAFDISLRYFQSDVEASEYLDKVCKEVESLLRDNWVYVSAIANKLIEKKELSKVEIIQILEG
jgi:hypothetical protein